MHRTPTRTVGWRRSPSSGCSPWVCTTGFTSRLTLRWRALGGCARPGCDRPLHRRRGRWPPLLRRFDFVERVSPPSASSGWRPVARCWRSGSWSCTPSAWARSCCRRGSDPARPARLVRRYGHVVRGNAAARQAQVVADRRSAGRHGADPVRPAADAGYPDLPDRPAALRRARATASRAAISSVPAVGRDALHGAGGAHRAADRQRIPALGDGRLHAVADGRLHRATCRARGGLAGRRDAGGRLHRLAGIVRSVCGFDADGAGGGDVGRDRSLGHAADRGRATTCLPGALGRLVDGGRHTASGLWPVSAC